MDAFGGWVFSLNEGFPGHILCHNFSGYIVYSLACGFQLHIYFRSILSYVETVILLVTSFFTSGIRIMVVLL